MIKYFTNVNYLQNELKQVVIENLNSHPINVKNGYVYFNTQEASFYGFNGLSWIKLSLDWSKVEYGTIVQLM